MADPNLSFFLRQEEKAVATLQCFLRRRRAWKQLLAVLNSVYEKEYDPGTDNWFYVNKVNRVACRDLRFGGEMGAPWPDSSRRWRHSETKPGGYCCLSSTYYI